MPVFMALMRYHVGSAGAERARRGAQRASGTGVTTRTRHSERSKGARGCLVFPVCVPHPIALYKCHLNKLKLLLPRIADDSHYTKRDLCASRHSPQG